jgi:hypothetical protein
LKRLNSDWPDSGIGGNVFGRTTTFSETEMEVVSRRLNMQDEGHTPATGEFTVTAVRSTDDDKMRLAATKISTPKIGIEPAAQPASCGPDSDWLGQ